jgi:hypothetical protein
MNGVTLEQRVKRVAYYFLDTLIEQSNPDIDGSEKFPRKGDIKIIQGRVYRITLVTPLAPRGDEIPVIRVDLIEKEPTKVKILNRSPKNCL